MFSRKPPGTISTFLPYTSLLRRHKYFCLLSFFSWSKNGIKNKNENNLLGFPVVTCPVTSSSVSPSSRRIVSSKDPTYLRFSSQAVSGFAWNDLEQTSSSVTSRYGSCSLSLSSSPATALTIPVVYQTNMINKKTWLSIFLYLLYWLELESPKV